MDRLVTLKDVRKTYYHNNIEVNALAEVNLSITQKDIISIMGPSGSGKTTLLNMIGGLDKPTSGKIIVSGKDLAAFPDNALTLYRRNHVGFIFQSFNLMPMLSALDNVELPMMFAKIDKNKIRESNYAFA